MAFFGLRKWPTPVLKPIWPFMAAGAVTFYLVSSLQDAAVRSPEYSSDPKNPHAQRIAAQSPHH
ncbi:ATP synthase j chain-domain-containing protein [Vararia minispora EC-137]|uniref:ATP synthase j chain-domain-containing protein n=1 Tax=Vararia minispora EC-137 TaxID=1314806 RepID=A0ACB8Q4N8_9AGAM|nr:ATP synthase j chain-domain-containing protein [Vararia minispora EC-137]